jgi:hypothetical protein
MKTNFYNPFIWLFVSALLLAACTYLPLRIKNDNLRNFVMRWVLVPVSIVIIVYTYPVGIEVFKNIALRWKS